MRILKRKYNLNLPDDDVQKFFIETWYSLIHQKSLDSHRIRCMNSLNIGRELQGLISRLGELRGVEKDIAMVSEETLDILKSDFVIKRCFQDHLDRLNPLLKKQFKRKGKQEKKKSPEDYLLTYYLKDIREDLENNYLDRVVEELDSAIFGKRDKEETFHLTSTLLSLLVDNGHSMGALFSMVGHVFCSEGDESFRNRFGHLKTILSQGEFDYKITFRLTDFSKYNATLAEVGGISFSSVTPFESDNASINKFKTPGLNVVFACTIAKGLDAQSAGLRAKQQLDNILDLIRFELEGNVVKVDEKFTVRKSGDENVKIYRLPARIPNPSRNLDNDEFQDFLDDVEYVLAGSSINTESRKKITSAFRFYRMGRDTSQYENKFINWWTALEYLLRTGGEGSIITDIEEKLSSALLLEYAAKHLKSYISACVYCGVDIGSAGISPADFFQWIHAPAKLQDITNQLDEYPILTFSLEKFQQNTKDNKSISKFLDIHENHLRWHIHRLWRMRCDIVHSAEYTINLTLLSANLEYYLKTLLGMVLKYLGANPCIESLEELFARIGHMIERLKDSLKKEDTTLFEALLKEIKI